MASQRAWLAGNDLYLFLQFGSRHRTREEMEALFENAGLAVLDVSRAAPPRGLAWDVIEGRRR